MAELKTRSYFCLLLVLSAAAPAPAEPTFHLFGEGDAAAPFVLRPGLDGLPPERPLAAAARKASPVPVAPALATPADPAASLPRWEPRQRNFALMAAEVAAIEVLPWAFNRYVSKGDYAYISLETIKNNFQTGFTYDHDAFDTNQSSHPLHGSLYFNAARSNGYTFWESGAVTFFGSFLWETVMENEPPAINDMVNTTLGGMARGEIEHRLAIMIVDNTARGFGRILREVTGLVVDPMGGFNRLVRGEWWKQFQNPPDRFPDRLYFEMDGFYQHRSGSAVAGADTNQGGGAAIVRYGDLFDGRNRAPFDYFDASGEIAQPAASLVTQLASRGLLTDWIVSESPAARQRLGLFLHFDYFNDAPLFYGAQAFAFDHLMRVPLGKDFELTTEVGLSAMPLASVQADYSTEENNGEINRGYDFSPGGGVHAFAYVRRHGVDIVKAGFSTQWQHTSNGISDNSRIESALAQARLPLSHHVAFGGAWAWTSRLSTYSSLPTVYVSAVTWRIFGAVMFR
jgi:hypothetical protein